MSLTAKYTLYIFLIFAVVLVSGFYFITKRANLEMQELTSDIIYTSVESFSDVMCTRFEMLPFIATHEFDDKKFNWLKANYMYFGGNTVNLQYEYLYDREKKRAFIKFSGEFTTFRINEATVDLYAFFKSILGTKAKLKAGYYYVMDSLGNVIYHDLKERVGLNAYKEGMDFLIEEFLTKRSGYVRYEYQGDEIKAFFKEMNLPFELKYYDEELGSEKDVKFFMVNAVSLSKMKERYADFISYMYFLILPVLLGVATLVAYLIALIGTKNIKKQSNVIKDFSANISNTVSNLSTSAAEMEKIAESTSEVARKLSEITQNFATSVEEGRYEVDASLKSINSFIELLSKVNEEISNSVGLIESLTDLNDRIAYLSDTISVLAINASIESSKEKIDREGIAKIVEHITKISGEARETAKRTKKTIDSIQKSLSQLALYSDRVRREGDVISSAIDNIKKVIEEFVKGINYIKSASENLLNSSEETSAGVEEIANAITELKTSMDKLMNMVKKLKL